MPAKTKRKQAVVEKAPKEFFTAQEIFAEGTERAKEKMREWWWRSQDEDTYWSEYILDQWKEALASVGFEKAEIEWHLHDRLNTHFSADVDVNPLIDFLLDPPPPSDCIDVDSSGKELFGPWLVYKCKGMRSVRPELEMAEIAGCTFGFTVDAGEASLQDQDWVSDDFSELFGEDDERATHQSEWRFEILDKLESVVGDFVYDLCRAIHRDIEEEYEHAYSDESLLDAAEANGWMFDEEGGFSHGQQVLCLHGGAP